MPAVVNLNEASIKGGSSSTAILFSKYVDPHITYMAKKARITSVELEDFPMLKNLVIALQYYGCLKE
ncbi:hypothetical protein [Flagellimonas pacifica]|uniref:hypothetical protein n=1 Tax=Flagellimonas pacifica TaxID=1247520 RepID=UPI001FAEA6B8|nr:hypothetical protein [Allomuricauda parva]